MLNITRNAEAEPNYFSECIGQHLIASYIALFDFKAKVFSCDVLNCKEIILKEVKDHGVKIIGFYVGADNAVITGHVIKWLKSEFKYIKTIIGGPEAYALGKNFLIDTHCDYIIIGEGEIPVLNLLRYEIACVGSKYDIKSLRFLDDNGEYIANAQEVLIADLDKMPFPSRENSLNKNFRLGDAMGILTGRGCPFRCGFCFEGAASKTVRFRSIENVINEIEAVRAYNKSLRCVHVYDDTFTLDYNRVKKFFSYMKQSGLNWSCEGHVSKIYNNPEMLYEMADSGLFAMQIGIESGSQEVLNAYNKGISPDMIKDVVKLCKAAGLNRLEGNYIIGGAFESSRTILESINHAKELIELGHGIVELNTVFFAPYYGTPITNNPGQYGLRFEQERAGRVIVTMTEAVVSTNELAVNDIVKIKLKFDEELKQKYCEEACKCTKDEIINGSGRGGIRLINHNWRAAWSYYNYISEFLRHISPDEQTLNINKYPVRTVKEYETEGEALSFYGIKLDGLYAKLLLMADGRMKVHEICSALGLEPEDAFNIYQKLNNRCFIYFAEF